MHLSREYNRLLLYGIAFQSEQFLTAISDGKGKEMVEMSIHIKNVARTCIVV